MVTKNQNPKNPVTVSVKKLIVKSRTDSDGITTKINEIIPLPRCHWKAELE